MAIDQQLHDTEPIPAEEESGQGKLRHAPEQSGCALEGCAGCINLWAMMALVGVLVGRWMTRRVRCDRRR